MVREYCFACAKSYDAAEGCPECGAGFQPPIDEKVKKVKKKKPKKKRIVYSIPEPSFPKKQTELFDK